ncbi:MAG: hypothetical protein ACXWQO_03505, partial [Bdellovibrionota bacterium]
AFLATYQKVSLYDGKNLGVLSPKKFFDLFRMEGDTPKLTYRGQGLPAEEPDFVNRTLGYYSAAAYWFDNNYLRAELTYPPRMNKRIE